MKLSSFALARVASIASVALLLWLFHSQVVPIFEAMGGLDNRLLVLATLFATLAVSLNLINGITGQFSIGHAAFYQIGAYAAGYVTIHYYRTGQMADWMWLVLMVVVGAIMAGIAGLIVGLPSLRLYGDYLAVATLGFGEIIRIAVQNTEALGGSYGLSIAEQTSNRMVKITPIWMVVLLLIFCVAVCRNLLKTSQGLKFLAVREDELAASSMGVNTTRTKVIAFVIGAAMAGMSGALFAHYEGFITIKNFDMTQSFLILAMVVIGGTGSITGAAVAGFVLTLLPESLRDLPNVPAISLFAFIAAAILIIWCMRKVRHFFKLTQPGVGRSGFSLFGMIGCAGMIYVSICGGIGLFEKLKMAIAVRGGVEHVAGAYPTALGWSAALPAISSGMIMVLALAVVAGIVLNAARLNLLANFGYLVVALGGTIGLTFPIAKLFGAIPFLADLLADTSYPAGKLRFPFFAICLVVVMLSRPAGLFGHHEFSWSWVKSLFGKKGQQTAVSS